MDGMKIVGDLFGAGQDVPAAGGQERPGDEALGRLPRAVHGGREGAGAARGPRRRRPRPGQGRAGHGQGRRARHRQEHRRRGARLQQLRGHRPRRDGAGREDPGHRGRRGRRRDRAVRADHPVAGRDGRRRRRDAAPRPQAAAADRRRHHLAAAHRGPDRPGLRRRRPCTCSTRPGWSAWSPTCSTPTGPRSSTRPTGPSRSGCASSTPTGTPQPLLTARAGPGQPRAGRLRRPARARVHRRPGRRAGPGRAARDDRLAVPVPRLGAEGQVPGDPRPAGGPRALRRRATRCSTRSSPTARCRPAACYGFWPAHAEGDDIVRRRRRRALPDAAPADRQAGRPAPTGASPTTSRPAGDHLGGFAVAIHGAEELAARYEAEHDDYRAIMVKALADRLAEAFAEYIHLQARRDWFEPDAEPPLADLHAERFRGIRPGARLPGQPRPQREAGAVRPARRRRGSASA